MRLVRSWPAQIPEGRAYVVDGIERLVMGGDTPNYDYRCLTELDDDVALIEWDIAVGNDQLARFMARAAAEPDRVRVAPYLLYRSSDPRMPFYVHRIREAGSRRWVLGPEDTHCQMFGFGLTYLPRQMIVDFVASLKDGEMFSDTTFSRWHMRHAEHPNVAIDWDCHCTHLHADLPAVP
jgi:hypothetical protein